MMRQAVGTCAVILASAVFAGQAQAEVHTVPFEFPAIQAAIDHAAGGDTVLVAPGEYEENPDFRGKAITVMGFGGPEITILRAALPGSTVAIAGVSQGEAVLVGFTIQAGRATEGGGIRVTDSRARIVRCRIRENRADVGGGLFCEQSQLVVTDCAFEGNSAAAAGGGLAAWGLRTTLTIRRSGFRGNDSSGRGGGLWLRFGATVRMEDCTVRKNRAEEGGGLASLYLAATVLDRCTVSRNIASRAGGGVFQENARFEAFSCILAENQAAVGGGVHSQPEPPFTLGVAPVLLGCTVARNSGADGAGVHVDHGTDGAIVDTVIAINRGCGLWAAESDFARSHNDIWGNRLDCSGIDAGEHSISLDPRFVDAARSDFHLQSASPCVDRGLTLASLTTDRDGDPRPYGRDTDIGADEWIEGGRSR